MWCNTEWAYLRPTAYLVALSLQYQLLDKKNSNAQWRFEKVEKLDNSWSSPTPSNRYRGGEKFCIKGKNLSSRVWQFQAYMPDVPFTSCWILSNMHMYAEPQFFHQWNGNGRTIYLMGLWWGLWVNVWAVLGRACSQWELPWALAWSPACSHWGIPGHFFGYYFLAIMCL